MAVEKTVSGRRILAGSDLLRIAVQTGYFFFSASSMEATTAGSVTFVLGSMRWRGLPSILACPPPSKASHVSGSIAVYAITSRWKNRKA